ncbi:hypothetical protein K438DRAFT_1725677 [Mycena galopus ATCC 62051]|nr:hypothetical protein K438DRAFT_1725677 [Mycena galopus ATCC 62051]
MSATSPIPTALVVPIIETYAQGIRPAIAFILVQTMLATLLIPLLFMLFAFSTPDTRHRPVFILNVMSICLGMVCAGIGAHMMIRAILSPFANAYIAEVIVYTSLDVWKGWGAEAVLLLRVATVFPRRRLPLLLAFPIIIKTGRAGLNILFCVKWAQLLFNGVSNEYIGLADMPTSLFKLMICSELVDNSYVSFLFLWRLHQQRQSLEKVSIPESYQSRLQKIFWITSTNFVFPLIFNLIELIAVFTGSPVSLYAIFEEVNAYIAIICTVFATVWSSTISFKEAIAQNDTNPSSKPMVIRVQMETTDMISSGGSVKSGNWEEA